tara:strand:+ start:25 stop:471 length:447 start_codon:yes stop_codon:yes gene_type:complete
MGRAFLGLGSNLGEKETFLREAVDSFQNLKAVSGIYETEPVGGPDQDSYLNIVIELDTDLGARELLEHAQMLEERANRKREVRWGPRTLDVDVLWVEGEKVNKPDLIVPHPRMRERAFVMIPLGELEPQFLEDWNDPNEGEVQRLRDW